MALRCRDIDAFAQLAEERGISLRQLRLLADAWAEGGKAGVEALGPAPGSAELTDPVMRRAVAVIETWRSVHFPLDAVDIDVWRNRVTLRQLLPDPHNRTAPLQQVLVCQLRWTSGNRWHLYRRAAWGEWWPVVVRGRRRRQSLSACLDAVRVDLLNQFWGPPGPPADLAAEVRKEE